MSDMKCPVCNKGTVKEFETAPYFVCSNEFCPSYSETDTTEYDILIRTRKALDVAKDAIDVISLKYHKDTPSIFLIKYAQNAKAEITALEQKENNNDKTRNR